MLEQKTVVLPHLSADAYLQQPNQLQRASENIAVKAGSASGVAT